eukprot:CAMPEP_0184339370 /NCGR_PEP_ID=MMETSP1089-20130417/8032_1 /TAXON_ID=38269 ORGANISM="Gloeochaete wittrockiana, Strain SAG46.84" /NCGR_SAMPLE_ID=MMETSP1089 /ASSEMBLY_ACC=CAM_ASM_000445 /LENGTH=267 /DNA_ID=CAMNT_0026666559 /DNA_START=69 /DNA_END=872 /DNA_ORIENTATION=-
MTSLLRICNVTRSCSRLLSTSSVNPSPIVLVHGSYQGAWVWERVMPLLQAGGRRAVAVELPGSTTKEAMDGASPPTLSQYFDTVRAAVQREAKKGGFPVTLVGHSLGGAVIQGVGEQTPDRCRLLVFLAGQLLRDGESVATRRYQEGYAYVRGAFTPTKDAQWAVPNEAFIKEVFFNKCTEEDVAEYSKKMIPQAQVPLVTPIQLSKENYGTLPRVYIECLQDNFIPIDLQRRFHQTSPCREVISLDADHAPFLSKTKELAEILLRL